MKKILSFIKPIIDNRKISQHIKQKLPDELLYMKGKLPADNTDQSILYLTVHRCASRYILSIIKRIIKETGKKHIDVGSYLWRGGKLYREPEKVFEKHGYIFGPLYGFDEEEFFLPIPNLDDFKILLVLRDPRDVLTSYYYHHAFETYHNPAQQEHLLTRREQTQSKSIDEWVCEKTPIFKYRYTSYLEATNNRPNVLRVRYVDMLNNFGNFLDNLIRFINVDVPKSTVEAIIKEASFSVKKEDPSSHKRQVLPGDHVRKLKRETVAFLNLEFRQILKELNYKEVVR